MHVRAAHFCDTEDHSVLINRSVVILKLLSQYIQQNIIKSFLFYIFYLNNK